MIPAELLPPDVSSAADALRARDEPFAFATIVRTAGPTAAKPGAKALVAADGKILTGWLGGGCIRAAVRKAAIRALAEGQPQLISVSPREDLSAQGLAPGDEISGTRFAASGCPSKGTIEIFIEPCLPAPELVVLGASPVAETLAALAPRFQWEVTRAGPDSALAPPAPPRRRAVVVATQGQGDLEALGQALAAGAEHLAFVGSRRKFAALAEALVTAGHAPEAIAAIRAPAGLDIGAVTPEEIALSILAELTRIRRRAETKTKTVSD